MYLSIMKIQGDPDDLMDAMREHVAPVAARLAPQFGGISSTTVRTDEGLMVINLWKDDEGRHRLPEHPEMREALVNAGFRPDAKGYEVLAHQVVGEAPVAT
ncbi:MAG: hypothetical protein ACTHNU_13790 [Gaiellales bacterium]